MTHPTRPFVAFSFVLLVAAAPRVALGFCGFFVSGADQKLYNEASHVVLMRKGSHTVMTMSNQYQGPAADFAMVVPVPVVLHKRDVKTLAPSVFRHIDELTAPRLVEYWEQDPCDSPSSVRAYGGMAAGAPAKMAAPADAKEDRDHGVKIEARFSSGEYDVLVLSAAESGGLELWLREHNYKIPDGAAAALAPYIHDQMKFFVAKVNLNKVKLDAKGQAMLSPLQFSFESNELRLPVRLGLLNAGEKQDLLVYILHPTKRFEAANYTNVFVPTNLDVAGSVKKAFGAFYAELFDETIRHANNRAVVTEYAWDTSSCDPCPGPPLDESDIATLGGSRLGDEGGWVVTRLHTRYDRATLSEDLVFRAARAMKGGRADRDDGGGGHGAVRDESNNFQGRYLVRHYWAKKMTCEHPQRGVWGGPPDGREPLAHPATNLASAPRGQVKLADVVKTAVPSLGLAGASRREKAK